ncbi:Neprilysin-4 [Mortierella alpina]|nr:Neprilysin-4 [Mortierella alpina]
MAFDSLISFSIGMDPSAPPKPVLHIFAGPSFSYLFYGANESIHSYEEDVMNALTDIVQGTSFNASTRLHEVPASCLMEEVARDAVDFERRLAEIGLNDRGSNLTEFYSHKQAVEKLSLLTPSIDWALALDQILPAGASSNVSITLPRSRVLQDLEDLLQSTPPRKLQNFLIWLVIRPVLANPSLEEPFTAEERLRSCVYVVNSCLGHMAGYYFTQQTLEDGSQDIIVDMANSIRKALQAELASSTWLNSSTAEEAIKKINSTLIRVGYTTNLQSSESIQDYYKDYRVDPEDYLGNMLRCMAMKRARNYERLKNQSRDLDYGVLAQTLSAFSYVAENRIVIPAGVMQHIFNAQGPEYVNLGTMGFTLGHELMHGITGPGRFYDSSRRNVKWWDNSSSNAYAEKAKCFTDQYSRFLADDIYGTTSTVNGLHALNENIADTEALKVAFRVWQSRYRSDPHGQRYKNFKLPGLGDQAPEKLFFVSYAQLFCEKRPYASLQFLVETDSHSPGAFRVNSAVQSSIDFAAAFKCQVNATMNPVRKCDMW